KQNVPPLSAHRVLWMTAANPYRRILCSRLSKNDAALVGDFSDSPVPRERVSVPPVTFPVDGNYRVHHSNVSAEVMVKTIDQLINDLGDALDTVDQCFKFEIDWPMEPSFKASWDSTRMVNSLAAPEKALLKKETE
ncbi:hypothetical protein FOL46_004344, partial [Perkinsus olseni]